MMPMSAAAYLNSNATACVANSFSNGQLVNQYTALCAPNLLDKCSGITAISRDDKAIIIAFGGTANFIQLVTESQESIFGNKTQFIAGGNVSEYFFNAWKGLWNSGMQDDLLTARNGNPGYQLWVTGHSLGGSMASLAAAYVIKLGLFTSSQVTLYTFGQPRTGDTNYAAAHDQLLGSASWRVTHHQDPVPHLPTEDYEGYFHHKSEIWYNNNMTVGSSYAECDADEGSSCSDSNLLDLSISDHLHYFNKEVHQFGECGCGPSC
uniref:Fungal lipase-like domain-containing protein n=2 Tax=Acrobeloides nanus TaxID=290746 RepID=A0A914C7Z1_9BILA